MSNRRRHTAHIRDADRRTRLWDTLQGTASGSAKRTAVLGQVLAAAHVVLATGGNGHMSKQAVERIRTDAAEIGDAVLAGLVEIPGSGQEDPEYWEKMQLRSRASHQMMDHGWDLEVDPGPPGAASAEAS